MLYLNPPYHIINGVSLFSDHADPLQYYYLPLAPKLTRIEDPKTKQRIPQIQVIKYRGRAGNGGFLNFDANIGIEQEALEEIRAELKRSAKLKQPPRLAPVPLVDGTVKMMLFGKQTGDLGEEGATGPKFVLKIDQHAKPALYGDNQAAFSVQLDQEGVTILEKALQGEMSPIGIVYSLDFLALRPAYSVRVHADWERVQNHFEEHFGVDSLFASIDIDTAIDKLIESRAIVIEVDTFVPEGEDTSSIIGRRDQALNQVRDMVTDAFFAPSLDPVKTEPDSLDKAAGFFERMGTAPIAGFTPKFSYKKVDYTRIDKKVLNVNISERTTVKRSIYPQGHLTGLFRPLRDEGLDLERFIIPVDLDDKWFERRRVKVIARANFEEDSIGSLNVKLRYGNEPKNVILESSTAKSDLDWASRIVNDAMQREIAYNYQVSFKGVDSSERPIMLESPARQMDVENLEINPRELYSVVPIPVVALFSSELWKRYPHVEAQLRYTEEANGIRMAETFLLHEVAPKQTEQTWKMFVRDRLKGKFEYKLIYRAADHKDLVMPWVETTEEQVIIRDPFPRKRTLMIVPNFDWRDVERAFVDVSYEDKLNRISESQSFEFTEEDKSTKIFSVDLVNSDQRLLTYQVTVLYKDGRMTEIPPSFTLKDRVIVRGDMTGHKIVLVHPAEDFAKKKLKTMTVEIYFDDPDNGLSAADTFEFNSALQRAHFEYDYVDEQKSSYEYEGTCRFTNRMTKPIKKKTSNAEELSIPIP